MREEMMKRYKVRHETRNTPASTAAARAFRPLRTSVRSWLLLLMVCRRRFFLVSSVAASCSFQHFLISFSKAVTWVSMVISWLKKRIRRRAEQFEIRLITFYFWRRWGGRPNNRPGIPSCRLSFIFYLLFICFLIISHTYHTT